MVGWGSVVSWGWSWVIGLFFWVFGNSFVFNISNITMFVSRVGNNLGSAIG